MMSPSDSWITFSGVAADFAKLIAGASEQSSHERLEALLRLLDRLEIAYLDLPSGCLEGIPTDGPSTWKSWFPRVQLAFPELTTYHSINPVSLELLQPKLRAFPDELALVLSSIDRARSRAEGGDKRAAIEGARADYEQQIGAQIAHLRAYVYHQRFQPEGYE